MKPDFLFVLTLIGTSVDIFVNFKIIFRNADTLGTLAQLHFLAKEGIFVAYLSRDKQA